MRYLFFSGFEFVVVTKCFLRRVTDEKSVVAIDQNFIAGLELFRNVVQPDDGRNVERARHDGGVRCAAAQIGRHAQDAFAIHRRGVGRREIMRDEDVRLAHSEKRFGRFPLQITNDPARHVLNIDGAFAQIRIVNLAQRFRIAPGHFLKNIFHVAAIGFEFAQDLIDQRPILDHEQVRIEHARVLGADRFRNALLHLENLRACLHERGFEARDLFRHLARFDTITRNVIDLVAHHVRTAARNARTYSDTLETQFRFRAFIAHLAGE